MSSHLPYVIPGHVVPGPLYPIARAGYTRKPISVDPIREANAAVPDILKQKAEAAGQTRLRDDNLVTKKVIQQALQKQTASSTQTVTTDKQAQPSDLSWRG